jgi:hypothetical protein
MLLGHDNPSPCVEAGAVHELLPGRFDRGGRRRHRGRRRDASRGFPTWCDLLHTRGDIGTEHAEDIAILEAIGDATRFGPGERQQLRIRSGVDSHVAHGWVNLGERQHFGQPDTLRAHNCSEMHAVFRQVLDALTKYPKR